MLLFLLYWWQPYLRNFILLNITTPWTVLWLTHLLATLFSKILQLLYSCALSMTKSHKKGKKTTVGSWRDYRVWAVSMTVSHIQTRLKFFWLFNDFEIPGSKIFSFTQVLTALFYFMFFLFRWVVLFFFSWIHVLFYHFFYNAL